MANPQGRVFPLKWEEFDYAPFFANLRRIGYAGRISIEASSRDVPSEAGKRSGSSALATDTTDSRTSSVCLVVFTRPAGPGSAVRR
jgi:sugar phosphate isomerase/epimerase